MIIARYDVILDQSERVHLKNQLLYYLAKFQQLRVILVFFMQVFAVVDFHSSRCSRFSFTLALGLAFTDSAVTLSELFEILIGPSN